MFTAETLRRGETHKSKPESAEGAEIAETSGSRASASLGLSVRNFVHHGAFRLGASLVGEETSLHLCCDTGPQKRFGSGAALKPRRRPYLEPGHRASSLR